MIKIGDFSKLSNTSIRMLRYYDEQDVLKPYYVDDNQYRYYKAAQLEIVHKIQKLKSFGFTITQIKKMLAEPEIVNEELRKTRIKAIELEIQQLELAKKELLEYTIKTSEQYHVEKVWMEARKVVSLRGTVNCYMDEYKLWNSLYEKVKVHGIEVRSNTQAFAVYHDEEYRECGVDIEVQLTIDTIQDDIDGLHFYTTTPKNAATVIFHGSYDKMTAVTKSVMEWMETHHYTLVQPTMNRFIVSPVQAKEADWITQSYFIIEEVNHG